MSKRRDERDGLGTLVRSDTERETLTTRKLQRPPLYEVLLHNDDYTTQEFVVYVLMKFFQHDAGTAHKIMLHVHTKGIGVAGCLPVRDRRDQGASGGRSSRAKTRCRCRHLCARAKNHEER